MFPFDLSGSVRLSATVRSNPAMIKAVANQLAAMIDESDVTDVYVEDNRVRFRNPIFEFGDRNRYGVLAGFGSGTFDIEASFDGIVIRYALSNARNLVGFGLFTAFAAYVYSQDAAVSWELLWSFPVAPLLILFAIALAVTSIRVRFWLRRGLRELPELQGRVSLRSVVRG